jgi:hemolysin D
MSSSPHDFSPAMLRIQAEPPAPLPRAVLGICVLLVIATFAWAALGRLDIIAVAQGKLVPASYVKILQPAESGVLKEILVHEGEFVKVGQTLMRMDELVSRADITTVENELHLDRLQLRRIDAELNGSSFTRQSGDDPAIFRQVAAQYQANRRAVRDQADGERAELDKAEQELRAAQEMESRLRQTVPIYREQERVNKNLADDGYVSRLAVLDKTRERIEKEQELKAQGHQVASLRAAITQSRSRIAQYQSSYRQRLQNERIEIDAKRLRLEQEAGKQYYRNALLELRAPQDGVVKDLATHTVGTVVSPGTILMTLVPHNDPVKAEVWVTDVDAGFIREGHSARVKVAAYPFQKYGMVDGIVEFVSPDAATLPDTRQLDRADMQKHVMPPSGFRALISLAQPHVERDGQQFGISAGMLVSAEIKLGDRTVLEYVLSPVRKAIHEAGRER